MPLGSNNISKVLRRVAGIRVNILFKPIRPANIEEFHKYMDQEHEDEDEGIEDYKLGGYHTVHVGEVINNRYVVIQKIGWGHFSTVWLSKDFKYNNYVALKI